MMQERIQHVDEDRGITRVALMRGDEELSRALVVPMVMQLGTVQLRMDGIGGVATPEEHRNRGYSRRVLEACVEYMTAGDAVVSTLYGIPHFYPKFGYATLGPESVITLLRLDERDVLPDGVRDRPGVPEDLPSIQRLYRDETRNAYGALVRDDEWWTWAELERDLAADAEAIRVVERAGQVVGYAARASGCWWMQHWERNEPGGLKVAEAFAADQDAAAAVLAAVRRWARERGEQSVYLAIPRSCRVGAASMFQSAHVTERYYDEGEFMGRSTGLLPLMRALVPELEFRWRPVSCSMPAFAITIVTEDERVTISGDERGIEVGSTRPGGVEVRLDPGQVARLVFGGFDPELVLERAGAPEPARPIMSVLFPRHVPYIYPLDRF